MYSLIVSKMSNIKQHIVSYDTAKWMQDNGFDEPCFCAYASRDVIHGKIVNQIGSSCYLGKDKFDSSIPAPLFQQAIVWFQEKYLLLIEIKWDSDLYGFSYFVYDTNNNHVLCQNWAYETWYEAVSDAIESCIRIVTTTELLDLDEEE